MIVSDINVLTQADSCELRATVEGALLKEPFSLWYRFPASQQEFISADNGDPFVAALLVGAMLSGEDLIIPVPVSCRLNASLSRIQSIYTSWDSTLSPVRVYAPIRSHEPPPGSNVGLFFSSGTDSFYSLLKNMAEHPLNEDVITTLITVHGFDIMGQQKQEVATQRLSSTEAMAKLIGKSVLPVATNLRALLEGLHIPWGALGYGAVLVSTALAIERMFRAIHISAGYCYGDLRRDGTHPLLDPLWSTNCLQFVHDGCEANKLQKMALIAKSPLALDRLRTCWEEDSLEFNCGKCTKCLRTMVGLYIEGVLQRSTTFPHELNVHDLREMRILSEGELEKVKDLVVALDALPGHAEVRAALLECVSRESEYHEFRRKALWQIELLIPRRDTFVLVDDLTLTEHFGAARRILPYLERNGVYYGRPPDDETAIKEMERERGMGAKFIVFWLPALWHLQYYSSLNDHLRTNYRCLLDSEALVIFDLRRLA